MTFYSLLVLFPDGAAQDYTFKNVDCLKTHTCYDQVKNATSENALLILCMETGICSSRCVHNSLQLMWKNFTWLYRHLCVSGGTAFLLKEMYNVITDRKLKLRILANLRHLN